MTKYERERNIAAAVAIGAVVVGAGMLFGPKAKPKSQPENEAAALVAEPAVNPRWIYSTSTDQMTGATSHLARLQAVAPIQTQYGPEAVWVAVSSSDNRAIEITSEALASCSGDSTFVRVRFDDEPVEWAKCRHYSDVQRRGTAWLIPFPLGGTRDDPYPSRIRQARRMLIEVPTFDGPAAAAFNVEGLGA